MSGRDSPEDAVDAQPHVPRIVLFHTRVFQGRRQSLLAVQVFRESVGDAFGLFRLNQDDMTSVSQKRFG